MLVVVMAITWRPSGYVLGRLFVPDGIEYAVGAQRLATAGRYDIVVDAASHPPRYPPGFSCLLAPAYWIAPDTLTAGVWIERAIWSIGCAALSYALSRRFGTAAATLSIAGINVEPAISRAASTIMADAPAAAALLALLAVGLLHPKPASRSLLLAGLILALGVACRPLTIVAALPILPQLYIVRRRLVGAAALLSPSATVVLLTAIYNRFTFGGWTMNGYVYWLPAPYSRLDFVFHPSYLPRHFEAIANAPSLYLLLLGGAVAAIAIAALDRPAKRDLLLPLSLLVFPLTLIQAVYFFIQIRLYLPLIAGSCLCIGLALGLILQRWKPGQIAAYSLSVLIAGITLYRGLTSPNAAAAVRVEVLSQMRDVLPERGQVITFLEPVLFDSIVARGTRRDWIAATRSQEYAGKLIASHRMDLDGIERLAAIKKPPLVLLDRGAKWAVAHTADENEVIDRLARDGEPVFVDVPTLNGVGGLRERLERRFQLLPVPGAPMLVRCVAKPSAPRPETRPASTPSDAERRS